MRRLWRTTGSTRASDPVSSSMSSRGSTLARDVVLVCLADGLVGLSFGATAVPAGGSPFAAVAAGAVLNTRLFPYGLAVADVVGPMGGSDPVRDYASDRG